MRRKFLVLGLPLLWNWILGLPPAWADPSSEAVRQTIREYIVGQENLQGAFVIVDEQSGKFRQLTFVRVQEQVGKIGNYFYSCTEMSDVETGASLDLDFDMEEVNGKLRVVDIRIHKDNGKLRYTYDENDNIIPALGR